MLFAVSGVEVSPIIPFLVAFFVSFISSMGGVSGAFLLLPFQISILGYTSPSVSATNQVFNIIAIPSGVYRYIKEGRMLWPLTYSIIIGTLPGVFIGALIRIEYLPDPGNFKFFVAIVLLYVGLRLAIDTVKTGKAHSTLSTGLHAVKVTKSTIKKVEFEFNNEHYGFSSVLVYFICFLVGIVGGIYGIGGGAIVAPFFVAIIGLPVYTVAGAALMGTFLTSVAGVVFYHLLAGFYPGKSVSPDWILGGLFSIGGLLGMYFGARMQKFMPARVIEVILTACVLFVSGKYFFDFFY
jgi:uncharacterized membrane protein YfcA